MTKLQQAIDLSLNLSINEQLELIKVITEQLLNIQRPRLDKQHILLQIFKDAAGILPEPYTFNREALHERSDIR